MKLFPMGTPAKRLTAVMAALVLLLVPPSAAAAGRESGAPSLRYVTAFTADAASKDAEYAVSAEEGRAFYSIYSRGIGTNWWDDGSAADCCVLVTNGAKTEFEGLHVRRDLGSFQTGGAALLVDDGEVRAKDLAAESVGEAASALLVKKGSIALLEGGSLRADGNGSVALEADGGVLARGVEMTASEAGTVQVGRGGSLYLYDCALEGKMPEGADRSGIVTLGLSREPSSGGGSVFQMTGGSLTAKSGGLFCAAGGETAVTLSGVKLGYASDNPFLLRCVGDARCVLTASEQEMRGDVLLDGNSSLTVNLSGASSFTGTFRSGSGGESGKVSVTIRDEASKWVVTAGCTLDSLKASPVSIVDSYGNNVHIRDLTTGKLLVNGTSTVTITVKEFGRPGEDPAGPLAWEAAEEAVRTAADATDDTGVTFDPGADPGETVEDTAKPADPPEGDPEGQDTDHSARFLDVTPDEWYAEAVTEVYDRGLMNGISEGIFSPNTNVLRGMVVTILWRLEGEPGAEKPQPFADVEAHMYYTAAVAWAAEHGIVTGKSETEFAPNDPVTREQLAAMLYRYALSRSGKMTVPADTDAAFTDMASVSGYALPAVRWALERGLLNGMGDGTLNPGGTATRAQLAAILARFTKNLE